MKHIARNSNRWDYSIIISDGTCATWEILGHTQLIKVPIHCMELNRSYIADDIQLYGRIGDRVRPCIVKGKWQPQMDIINRHGFVGASGSHR